MVELQLSADVKIIRAGSGGRAGFHVVVVLALHDHIHVIRRIENEIPADLKSVVAPAIPALGNDKPPPVHVGIGEIQNRILHAAHPSAAV